MYADVGEEYENGLGELGASWFKRVFAGGAKKVVRNALAFVAGTVTLGLIPPKTFHITGHSAMQNFRAGRLVGDITAGAAAAIIVGPAILPYISQGGSLMLGGLKWVGGALMSIGPAAAKLLTSRGVNPQQATPQQAIDASVQTGELTQQDLTNAANNIYANSQGDALHPALHTTGMAPGSVTLPAEASILESDITEYLPYIAIGVVGIAVLGLVLKPKEG